MSGFNASDWALKHRSLIIFLMAAFVIAGCFSYEKLGRNEDPPFTIKTMVVAASWPGATTQDMLQQVTDRLEKTLEEIPYLDFVQSYTKPGQSVVYVNLKDSTPPEKIPDLWYEVRKKIGDMRSTLPDGVIGPNFNDEFGDTYGIIYALTSDGFSYREMRDYADHVRSELLGVPGVGKIQLMGLQDERIWLEFSPAQVAGLGLKPDSVIEAIRDRNLVVPAGQIDTGAEKVEVRVTGKLVSEETLKNIVLTANGRYIRLSDIVRIKRGTVDPPSPMFRFNGKPAIGIAISMAAGGNLLKFGEEVTHRVHQLKGDLPIGLELHEAANQAEVVDHAVLGFLKVLGEAILIVLAVSFISLGMRAGVVVLISIPLVLAMTFTGMDIMGIDLQRISLGALIIALGLLVDDAMITVEMMISRLEEGDDIMQAATYAFTSTAIPMLTGTLITIAGFLPVGLARSASGEYSFSLFAVVTTALISSWVVAVLFCPLLGFWILPKRIARKENHGHDDRLTGWFRGKLVFCMRHPWKVIAVTIAIFLLSLFGASKLENQFFPASDRSELLVDLTLPQNTSIKTTFTEVQRLEKILADDPGVRQFTSYVGRGSIRFYLPMDVQLDNDNYAQLVVVTKSLKDRDALRKKLGALFLTEFPNALGRATPLEMGPPVGWPVQIRVSGADPEKVRQLSFKVAQIMGGDPDIGIINYNWSEPSRSIVVNVDQIRAAQLGVTSKAISDALSAIYSGLTLTQVRDGTYLVDVVARASDQSRLNLATLRNLQLSAPNGGVVSLSQFATLDYTTEYPVIWRRDRHPTITVRGDLPSNVQPSTAIEKIQPQLDALQKQLPVGYNIAVGGTIEEGAKGMASIVAVVPLMAFVMLLLLMLQLHSFQNLLLVLCVAPLGLIGVVAALLPTGTPLGFIAILGIISLIGMIIRNCVILIDQVEHFLREGVSKWKALEDATIHRMRPILLTAAAAILGMIPIAPQVFWGPMAFAVMGGLFVATILTLIFLPSLYVVWYRVQPDSVE